MFPFWTQCLSLSPSSFLFQSKFCSVYVWLHDCGLCDRITGPVGPCLFIQSGRLHWREAAVFKSPLWQLWQVSAPHTHHLTLSRYTMWLWHTLLCSIDVFVVFKHYGTIMILQQCVCTCCVVNIPKLKTCTNNVLLISSALQSDFWHHHSCDGHPGRSEWCAIEQEAENQNLSSWSTSLCCRTPPRCSLSLSVHHVCSG